MLTHGLALNSYAQHQQTGKPKLKSEHCWSKSQEARVVKHVDNQQKCEIDVPWIRPLLRHRFQAGETEVPQTHLPFSAPQMPKMINSNEDSHRVAHLPHVKKPAEYVLLTTEDHFGQPNKKHSNKSPKAEAEVGVFPSDLPSESTEMYRTALVMSSDSHEGC
ncbi:unnamed protein product [Protopolystoma xenopodis]|uniref:Uncharacterized protein n=1 Tax=Protopolystoma xenopodis TaxID=117903 RepID=A0A3S5AS69_9PLAT|nr:unnamed protein product [Protopolystoma xenopodis]